MNNELTDGTYRFDINIPVDEAGEPGNWCTYTYDPISEGETGKEIVRALRFIEQPSSAPDGHSQ